ncbi:MAG TPA: ABC transporter permease [Gaiellaceae bacterium]|nr:ABC transporter permease [Gaiellaceae bacterium]
MIRVALRDLAGRKLRSFLTALAIVLGVAMVSGTYVLTDTIMKAFDTLFESAYEGVSVVVAGERVVDFAVGGAPTVPEELLDEIRELDRVEAAWGTVESPTARLIDREGEPIVTGGAPTLAIGVDREQDTATPLVLSQGRWPTGGDEVVIDEATAERHRFGVGDEIRIAAGGPVETLDVVGVARFGTVSSIGGATFAVLELERAQRLLRKEDELDTIQIRAAPGVPPEEVIDAVEPLVPEGVVVRSAAEQADSEAGEVNQALRIVRYFLLAFAGIALFVGAFVIFNTFTITVAQRAREFATLRTLGASRRQVLGSIAVETLVVGAVASVVGILAGLGLARLLDAVFTAFEIDLPRTAQVLAPRTIVVSLLIGIGVTVLAGLVPGFRATRVPPILAVREGATLPPSRLAPLAPWLAAAVSAVALVLLGLGLFAEDLGTRDRLLTLAAGAAALFVGVALVSARLVRPLAATVGRGTERLGGIAGRIARENAARNPGRTAMTAAALMIGLALVTFVAVLGAGLRGSVVETVDRQVRADYVIGARDGFNPFPAGAGDAVAAAPEVEVASSVRADAALVGRDETAYVTGIDPDTITRLYRFEWVEGSDEVVGGLARDGAIVTRAIADSQGVGVGDRLPITAPGGTRIEPRVIGIYEPPPLGSLLGDVSISIDAWDETFPQPVNLNTYVDVRGDPIPEAAAALERRLEEYPEATLQTKEEYIQTQQRGVDILLNMLYVLLALSVVVSLFGMVNTLALSVFERTRELGLLRAVGMTRRQARRMIRHESVITALIGAVLGLPLGVFLAGLVTAALRDEGVVFSLPWLSLVAFTLIAAVAGVLAAILPARRASRLDVLKALQYE